MAGGLACTFEEKIGIYSAFITGYRTCKGTRSTAHLGSTFHREYEYFLSQEGKQTANPRKQFLEDLERTIGDLLDAKHSVILMLDANSVLTQDRHLRESMERLNLTDLHEKDPAPSTYIGASDRRIDYMFGSPCVENAKIAGGTLSYVDGPQSDHRGLFVDICADSLLSYHATDNSIQSPQARILKSGNPELVAAYIENVKAYYEDHAMVTRITKLYNEHEKLSDDELSRQLNTWDEDQGRAMIHAEKKIGRRGISKPNHWSPELRNAGILCRYWRLRLKARNHADYSETYTRLLQTAQQHDPHFTLPSLGIGLEPKEMSRQLKQAIRHLKKCQQESRELRHRTYQELLIRYENDNDPSTQLESIRRAKIVRNTMRAEDIRANFRDIRLAAKPFQTQQGGLKSLMIPSLPQSNSLSDRERYNTYDYLINTPETDVRWETILDREEIERYLLAYNQRSFRAAAASPCGHGVVLDQITFTTMSNAATEFMEGLVPPEWHEDNSMLKEFLHSFYAQTHSAQSGEGRRTIRTRIRAIDITKGFGKWREATSTSPSGRHLGHYKAIIQDPTLLDCLTKFLSITVQRGLSISRWKQAVNVMLEKDPGKPRINRLRIIHLFEADFNLLLKLLWGSRLVKHAAKYNLLNDGQHGSVPGRTAMELVMLNQLSNDLCRTQKVNIIRFENDASACYDRILVHLGMLAARRCGMPTNAVALHSGTLLDMKYKVKTHYGISEGSYQGSHAEPLFGTGQGSGASPAVWLTLVVVMMNTLERLIRERISFASPDDGYQHNRLIDAFVDDTSLAFNDYYQQMPFPEMVKTLENAAQTWQRLLSYSGGALNLKKCSWSCMYWQWTNGRPQLCHTESQTDHPTIRIDHDENSSDPSNGTTIRFISPRESIRILGVHLNPMGIFDFHIDQMKKKADSFASCLRSSRIRIHQSLTFLKTMYSPSMFYSLPAVAAKEEKWADVQRDLIETVLQKMGASKTTPYPIRHGPNELGGLNLVDLRTETGIARIKFLRNAIYSNSEAGRLLILSIKATQMEAGIGEHILLHPDIQIPYVTNTWITSLRTFLSHHSIKINITNTLAIRYNGQRDACIMNPLYLKGYTTQQQADINLVRLYLQVITLSDMSLANGQEIQRSALQGERSLEFHNRPTWPRQAAPTASQRRLWKRYLEANYIRYGTQWRQSLGPVVPIQLRLMAIEISPPAIQEHQSLKQYLQSLPVWHRRLLLKFHQPATDLEVWRAFRSRRRLTIASDGGLRKGVGTFGWKIVSRPPSLQGPDVTLFEGSGPVDGPRDIANSTRSELGGLTAPMLLCFSLANFWGLRHKCRLRWLTDSKAAISRVEFIIGSSKCVRKTPEDIDYVSAIRSLHKSLGLKLTTAWVKGHQDERIEYERLLPDAKLNVDTDHLATEHMFGKSNMPTQNTIHVPWQQVSILINGIRYPSQVDAQLRYHINGSYLKQYLQHKHGWSEKVWGTIDMHAFGQLFKTLPPKVQIHQMKFVHDLLAVGHRKGIISHATTNEVSMCPCCRKATETTYHLLQCTFNKGRSKALAEFKTNVRAKEANRFGKVFADVVMQWLHDPLVTPSLEGSLDHTINYNYHPQKYKALIQKAIQAQTQIGWLNLLKGYISTTWHELASTDFSHPEDEPTNRDDGSHRIARVLRALQTLTHTIWIERNNALHNKQEEQSRYQKTALDAEIANYHADTAALPAADRHYCDTRLDVLLRRSPSYKRRWIYRVRRAREMFKITGASNQTKLTKYYQRSSHSSSGLDHQGNKTTNTGGDASEHRREYNLASSYSTQRNNITQRPIITTQQIITKYLRERASNQPSDHANTASPPPR